MYLHLGKETVVNSRDIIGIFDLDNVTVSRHSRNFLKKAQQSGKVTDVTKELPKSFVLCEKAKQSKIYISQLSSTTLLKRAEQWQNNKDKFKINSEAKIK